MSIMDIKKRLWIFIAAIFAFILILETVFYLALLESPYWRLAHSLLVISAIYFATHYLFYNPQQKVIEALKLINNDDNPSIHKRIEMPTQLGTALTEPVNQILNKQEIILNDLADSVARLQPMTQELRDTYSSMAQKAAMQNSHSRVLEQTMGHIEQATQNVSSQIREITLTAEESHQTTAAAAQSMLETVASINDLAEDINLASSEMSVLKDGSDKIHTILEVITSIA